MLHFNLILFTIFLLMIVLYLKRLFHWKYLKEIRRDLNHYASEKDYKRKKDLSKPSEYEHFAATTWEILLPSFSRERSKENSRARSFAKLIRFFLVFSYVVAVFLILFLIFREI